jgi:CheY-like chemotaxis protein
MKRTVLIVEDEPLLLMMAVDIVEDAGFQALEARNADEAIRVLEDVTDVAIMWTDIDMPGSMDGLMLAAAVRDRWPPIEIVVVSGMRNPDVGELPERGVFYSKPYDVRRITETLQQLAS